MTTTSLTNAQVTALAQTLTDATLMRAANGTASEKRFAKLLAARIGSEAAANFGDLILAKPDFASAEIALAQAKATADAAPHEPDTQDMLDAEKAWNDEQDAIEGDAEGEGEDFDQADDDHIDENDLEAVAEWEAEMEAEADEADQEIAKAWGEPGLTVSEALGRAIQSGAPLSGFLAPVQPPATFAPKAPKALKEPIAPKAKKPAEPAAEPKVLREGTKQATLIAMLRAPGGASMDELVAATGWQKHTVRGAMAGALKKRLGLEVTSDKIDGRGRVYALASA